MRSGKGRQKGSIPWNKGIPCDEKTKQKIREKLTGRIINEDSPYYKLTGKRFGRLFVQDLYSENRLRYNFWLCKCDCGNKKIISGNNLIFAGTKSCGCLQREIAKKFSQNRFKSHGMNRTRPHKIWCSMKSRCRNRKNSLYGGRGIEVCERWQKFEDFWEDMKEGYADNLSIDRIDNNGNYEPSNCRWATRKVQGNNIRSNTFITFKGETQTIAQWSEALGIKKSTLCMRIYKYKWPVEKALGF